MNTAIGQTKKHFEFVTRLSRVEDKQAYLDGACLINETNGSRPLKISSGEKWVFADGYISVCEKHGHFYMGLDS